MTVRQQQARTVRLCPLWHSWYVSKPTRQLCAVMNLDVRLRDFVLELFLGERHRAWGPNYGVDSTAVIRHAWRARRWQRKRDVVLGLTVLALVVLLVSRWWIRGGLLAVGATVAWIMAGIVVRRLMRRRQKTVWQVLTWSWHRKKIGRRLILAGGIALVVALTITAHGLVRAVRREDGVIVLAFACAVLVIGILDAFVVVGRARRALTDRPDGGAATTTMPRHQAPPMPDRLERRLGALHDGPEPAQSSENSLARVVAYDFASRRGSFMQNTFVGSGSSLGQFEINIDVSRGRSSAGGSRKKPKRVDLVSLHRSMEGIALTKDLPGSWSGYRMYVDGQYLNEQPELLPRAAGSPNGWLSLNRMHTGLANPTGSMRTYLCFQVPVVNWDEHIILTLFIRADLTGKNLILHTDTLMLPMMAFADSPLIRGAPKDWWTHCTMAARLGSTRIWRAAVRSFLWLLGDAYRLGRRHYSTWNTRYQVRHEKRVSHGAVFSVREKLAEGVVMVHPNAEQDVKRTISFLMQALRNGLSEYLKSRNIDTSSLESDIRTVINSQQNKIGEFHANNVVFGNKGTAGGSTSSTDGTDR